jgi:predicted TIM-barrel fold metal-dependent hydrolase
LARIPEKYNVNNVYAEIGSSFASTAVTDPVFCAAFVGQLVNLMGPERVVWGTDSVWYGSPQWQIEAMRRLEIPDAMMKKQGWKTKLGDGRGAVKNKIFGENSAKLYRLDAQKIASEAKAFDHDMIAQMKAEYLAMGGERSNAAYGYIAKEGRLPQET